MVIHFLQQIKPPVLPVLQQVTLSTRLRSSLGFPRRHFLVPRWLNERCVHVQEMFQMERLFLR